MMATATEQALPRVLAGVGEQPMTELAAHLERHGPCPSRCRPS
jgi:hypothetical protein